MQHYATFHHSCMDPFDSLFWNLQINVDVSGMETEVQLGELKTYSCVQHCA